MKTAVVPKLVTEYNDVASTIVLCQGKKLDTNDSGRCMVVYDGVCTCGGVWWCMVVHGGLRWCMMVYVNVFALIRRTQHAVLQECSAVKCPSANPAGAAAAAAATAATKKTR
jgi:hypothetical protein